MSITVQIPTALRRLTAGTPRLTCAASNLPELFSVLDTQFPDLKPHLRDEAGQTRRFVLAAQLAERATRAPFGASVEQSMIDVETGQPIPRRQ